MCGPHCSGRYAPHSRPRCATDHTSATSNSSQSMKEIQAGRDLLRAEFAMSTRRLEINLEQLKNKSTGQVVELGRRDDVINRLKIQRDALKVDVITLKAQLEALKKRPVASSKGVAAEASAVGIR